MSRIVPQAQENKQGNPAWLNGAALVQVAKGELSKPLQTVANVTEAADSKIISYACVDCKKVYFVDSAALKAQANLAERSGQEVNYSCPSCSSSLIPDKLAGSVIKAGVDRSGAEFAQPIDLQKEAGQTYNTYLDRHVVYKAIQALTSFAGSMGMVKPEVKYKNAERVDQPGRAFASLDNINCEISWVWSMTDSRMPRRGRITASVGVDASGRIQLPRTFKLASGEEYPFEKEVIKDLASRAMFEHKQKQDMRATDTPTHRKHDPSRFHAVASQENNTETTDDLNIEAALVESNFGTSSYPQPGAVTPGSNVNSTNPSKSLIDPTSGNEYQVVDDMNPDNGLDVVNPETQQQGVIKPEDQNKFKQVIQPTASDIANATLAKLIGMPKKQAMRNKKVASISKSWNETREGLKSTAKKRQIQPDTDETGHDKRSNIPFAEKKDIEVGLTEFPKDQDKKTGEGYKVRFKEMDENQVKDREHFHNETKLPIDNMKREELSEYAKEPELDVNYGLNYEETPETVESALLAEIGLTKVAGDEPGELNKVAEDVQEGPVQFKSLKKKSPLVDEPAVIDQAGGKVKEAITKFKNVQAELDETKAKLAEITKPIKDTLAQAEKPYKDEIAAKSALLKSYLDMIFDQLAKTDDQIAAYADQLYAAGAREKDVTPSATLAEILDLADVLPGEIGELIRELQAIVEEGRIRTMIERFLFEYPISEQHRTKKVSSTEGTESIDSVIDELQNWLHKFLVTKESLATA